MQYLHFLHFARDCISLHFLHFARDCISLRVVFTIVDGDGDELELEIPEGVVAGETFFYRIE